MDIAGELASLKEEVSSLKAKVVELEKNLAAISKTVSQHERDTLPIRRIGPGLRNPIPPEEDFREYE